MSAADANPTERLLAPEPERSARAPLLPIEGPLVRAVRELEALKGQIDGLLLLLEHAPGSAEVITGAVDQAVARMNGASAAIWQFQQIRSCEGQG